MYLTSHQFKNKVKAIPVIGILAFRVWWLIKKYRRRTLPKECAPDYSKLSVDEIQRDLDKRY